LVFAAAVAALSAAVLASLVRSPRAAGRSRIR
jgi:hypothetical protein